MEVIKSLDFSRIKLDNKIAIALGSFDGLHLGHQTVINFTIKQAEKMGVLSGVYTFTPHPLEILNPELAPPKLISNKQKIDLLSSLNLDYYFEQIFTSQFSQLDYETFVKDYLVERLQVAAVIIGEDFRFGRQGKGNLQSLKKLGLKYGFIVRGIKTVKNNHKRISSTLIRKLITDGKLKNIPEYFGRYYQLEGIVVHGDGRGRQIGIPTANLDLSTNYALPPNGVYACFVYHRGEKFRGIVNFGVKPTFKRNNFTVEVHLLDFPGEDLYDKKLYVDLVDFIRKEMTFSSPDELIEQIKKDILYTDNLLCYNY